MIFFAGLGEVGGKGGRGFAFVLVLVRIVLVLVRIMVSLFGLEGYGDDDVRGRLAGKLGEVGDAPDGAWRMMLVTNSQHTGDEEGID